MMCGAVSLGLCARRLADVRFWHLADIFGSPTCSICCRDYYGGAVVLMPMERRFDGAGLLHPLLSQSGHVKRARRKTTG